MGYGYAHKLWAVVNTVMNIQAQQKAGICASSATIIFGGSHYVISVFGMDSSDEEIHFYVTGTQNASPSRYEPYIARHHANQYSLQL